MKMRCSFQAVQILLVEFVFFLLAKECPWKKEQKKHIEVLENFNWKQGKQVCQAASPSKQQKFSELF